MGLPRGPKRLIDIQTGSIGHMKFPAKLAGIGHPKGPDFVAGNGNFLCREPAECPIAQIRIGTCAQNIPRPRPIQCQGRPIRRQGGNGDIIVAAMPVQMVQQTLFKERGANQIEPVRAHAHDGRFQFNPTGIVQHVGQGDRSALPPIGAGEFLWHAVGGQPIKQGIGVRPGNHHLGKCRHIHDADGLADGPDLGGDDVIDHGSFKGIVVLLHHVVARKPAGTLEPIDLFMNRALGLQQIIKRRGLDRAACKPVEMRERNFMAQAIIFLCLLDLPVLGGIGPETARIILSH